MPRLAALIAVALLATAACGTTPSEPAPNGSPPRATVAPGRAAWEPVEPFLDAYLAAWSAGDADAVGAFLAPDARVEVADGRPARDGLGWPAIEPFLRGQFAWAGDANPEYERERTFVSVDGATVTLRESFPDPARDPPATTVSLLRSVRLGFVPAGIVLHRRAVAVGDEAAWEPRPYAVADPSLAGGVEDLVDAYVAARSGGDDERLAGLYSADAVHRDSLAGHVLTEPKSIAGAWSGAVVARDPAAPALVTTHAEYAEGRLQVVLSHVGAVLGVDDGCPRAAFMEWAMVNGRIAAEEVFWELDGLRRCGIPGGGSAPTGWWDAQRLPGSLEPSPPIETPSGRMVPSFNAGVAQQELVTWALGRFAAAGLAEPPVRAVVFPPSEACRERAGATVDQPEGATVHVCFTAGELCTDADCTAFARAARITVLHELAHAWEAVGPDAATRAAFLDLRELDSWTDDPQWSRRGTEQAAEIVAWGLLDEPVELVKLPDHACPELLDAFRLLTGVEPLRLDPCG